jgi:selenocysteine lyase/cysteine desulfurase
MVSLRLPDGAANDLQERLYEKYRIEVPTFRHGDGQLIRASFQGYNDPGDLERLKRALAELL